MFSAAQLIHLFLNQFVSPPPSSASEISKKSVTSRSQRKYALCSLKSAGRSDCSSVLYNASIQETTGVSSTTDCAAIQNPRAQVSRKQSRKFFCTEYRSWERVCLSNSDTVNNEQGQFCFLSHAFNELSSLLDKCTLGAGTGAVSVWMDLMENDERAIRLDIGTFRVCR